MYALGGCYSLDLNYHSAAHIAKAWPPACSTTGSMWNLQKVHSVGGSWDIRDVSIPLFCFLATLRGT